MINRTPARDRPGALGWRRGSQYRRGRVMPGEGRGLSSRQTQDVVRDLEIGQPNNSETCSEAADGGYTRKRRQKLTIASMPPLASRAAMRPCATGLRKTTYLRRFSTSTLGARS